MLNEEWNDIIRKHAGMSESQFVQAELEAFLYSKKRQEILQARNYYQGKHKLPEHVIMDSNGNPTDAKGTIPNNKIINNLFDDLVDQKTNYLLSKPIDVKSSIDLTDFFNKNFQRTLKNLGKDAYIGTIAYLHPYIDNQGNFKLKRMKPEFVIPLWHDEEHDSLDAFIYFYEFEVYMTPKTKTSFYKVEYYKPEGVTYYDYINGTLQPDTTKQSRPYIQRSGFSYNWQSVPLIWFRSNSEEVPLLSKIKPLQDALNQMLSNFANVMSQDVHNTILVIKGYDGENLANFREQLARYGAIKITSSPEFESGVETLNIEVNASNYETIIKLLERAIITNGRGFDAKDDRMANNPNQMNINSMYSDIDLDANEMETEFQASLERLLTFINAYLSLSNKPISNDTVFIFNRDLPLNQSELIDACRNSTGIISEETIVANHPWTLDTKEELERIKKERNEVLNNDVLGTTLS